MNAGHLGHDPDRIDHKATGENRIMTEMTSTSTPFSAFSHAAFPVPARAGAGLKASHVDAILADDDPAGFFEIHAENYMGEGGRPHAALNRIREKFPLSIHGVGMSIGGPQARLDRAHLARFKGLVERYEPGLISEHLAWSTHQSTYFNDLLPLPYTPQTLNRLTDHIDEFQETIGRRMLLENPSSYLQFEESTYGETEFIAAIAARTGCGLLLDINNVFVSATNQQFSPKDYLAAFPMHLVGEIHLAGHAEDQDDEGDILLIDAHDRPVDDAVWALYEWVVERIGPVPTLIEWDNSVPDWPVLKREAILADRILGRCAAITQKEAVGGLVS